ncbi:hypothetical protein E2562_012199 [Oryza meyeriana var. granulata]|uniref:Uncharacterized protein n=1 Tax=Oryza meyeriana var. granulata TaxID=110450 RepID=A0A6G1F7R6_9ORYZ|nr:hypothetical protein E2562_012199 [Oryza meyeriana var. granulata]
MGRLSDPKRLGGSQGTPGVQRLLSRSTSQADRALAAAPPAYSHRSSLQAVVSLTGGPRRHDPI